MGNGSCHKRLPRNLAQAVFDGILNPREAFKIVANGHNIGNVQKRNCDHRKVEEAYKALEELCNQTKYRDFLPLLQLHRDTVENKSHLSPCFVTRKRCRLIHEGRLAGMVLPFGLKCMPEASKIIKMTCPETTHAYVIGKGPSIDSLSHTDFSDSESPVLCINESVKVIEKLNLPNPLFTVIQDCRIVSRCRSKKSHLLISYYAWKGSKCRTPDATVYFPEEIGGRRKSITASQCCRMLGPAGFTHVTFYGFDSCVTGNCDYADSIASKPDEFKPKSMTRDRYLARFRGYCREIRAECAVHGLRYRFRMPGRQWTVICVCRGGGIYADYHIEWLRKQVAEHIKTPHKFICINDVGYGETPLKHSWPTWWSKVEMYDAFRFGGLNLYLDLDTVINRDIILPDDLAEGVVYAETDQMRPDEIYGAVQMWKGDACQHIYEAMKSDSRNLMKKYRSHGDQALTTAMMKGKIRHLPLDVRSFKNRRDHRDADIILFHGDPRPWRVKKNYVPIMKYAHAGQWMHSIATQNSAAAYVQVGEGPQLSYLMRNRTNIECFTTCPCGNPKVTVTALDDIPEADIICVTEDADMEFLYGKLRKNGVLVAVGDAIESLQRYSTHIRNCDDWSFLRRTDG